MFDLTGRKALVTGASGGIGEEIARVLHAQGAIVGLHGTRVEKLEALAGELGDRVKMFPANLSDRDEVKALGQKAEAELEGVDILVNNAGITKDGLFVRMSRRGLGQRARGQPDRRVPADPRAHPSDDAPPLRPHHQHHLGGRRHRQSGPGQLLRLQGRHDRLLQVAGAGDRHPQRHRQLRRARLHRNRR